MILAGACHCGAVTVELETARALDELPLRECQCSFCTRHAARTTVDPDGHVRITSTSGALVRYRFGLGTADFLVCRRCGVYIGCTLDDAFASVNARVLDDFARLTQPPRANDWSGESAEGRRARRRSTWTPASVDERK